MGTTAFFAMISKFPEINSRISKAIALAPVTHLENMSGIQKYMVYHVYLGVKLINK